jgi:polar amino acid transport system substrate-binding protein
MLAVGVLILAACAPEDVGVEPDPDTEPDRGTLHLGFANEFPYGYVGPDGQPTGQAPEVARVVLERMGFEDIEATTVDFGALIDGLNAGRYDMIAAGMFITESRAAQALFTDPDYCAATAFAVPEGNPEGLTDYQSITDTGATLGVLSGAVEDGHAVDSGVPHGQIRRFPDTADLVDALREGIIDAFALTRATVEAQTAEMPGFEASEDFIPVIDGEEQLGCGGYVFRFDDKELRDEFNQVLNDMKQNNEILPIVEEFGFTDTEVEAAQDVTVEDLVGQPYDFGMNG